jgi:putative sterol carrier protein
MKVKVMFAVEKEMEMNENFHNTEEDENYIYYYLKEDKKEDFCNYLEKISNEINTKVNAEDVQVMDIYDEHDNIIYEE